MEERHDRVWKGGALVRTFLDGVRGGIPLAAEQIDVMLRVVAARGGGVERFADLGCGDGALSRAMLARYPQAQGLLVDFSEPMMDAARTQLGAHSPQPRFVVADLGETEWRHAVSEEASFDVIVSGFAIHHLPDPRKQHLYREIFSLLVPGGVFVNMEHVASRAPWIEAISDDLLVDSLYEFHRKQGGDKSRAEIAEEYVHRPDKAANILAPVEVQCAWLRDSGFADVDCYFKLFELAVFGGRRPKS